jgi:hypothetical protein
MSAFYVVEPIAARTIDRAYPLARACGCALSLREWQALLQAHTVAPARDESVDDRKRTLVARDPHRYVRGLCIYSTNKESSYGRLIDIPILIVVSAVDSQGVTTELVRALRSECERSGCSGIRFWPMSPEAWMGRQSLDAIGRTDHRLFLRPLPSAAEIEAAVSARKFGDPGAMD